MRCGLEQVKVPSLILPYSQSPLNTTTTTTTTVNTQTCQKYSVPVTPLSGLDQLTPVSIISKRMRPC